MDKNQKSTMQAGWEAISISDDLLDAILGGAGVGSEKSVAEVLAELKAMRAKTDATIARIDGAVKELILSPPGDVVSLNAPVNN